MGKAPNAKPTGSKRKAAGGESGEDWKIQVLHVLLAGASQLVYWLVVWNIFYFPIQLGMIIPIDELIFFRGVVGIPPETTNQYSYELEATGWRAKYYVLLEDSGW